MDIEFDLATGLKLSAIEGCIGGVVATAGHCFLGWQVTPLAGALKGAVSGGLSLLALLVSFVAFEAIEFCGLQNEIVKFSCALGATGLLVFTLTPLITAVAVPTLYWEFLGQLIGQIAFTLLSVDFDV